MQLEITLLPIAILMLVTIVPRQVAFAYSDELFRPFLNSCVRRPLYDVEHALGHRRYVSEFTVDLLRPSITLAGQSIESVCHTLRHPPKIRGYRLYNDVLSGKNWSLCRQILT